ncbi:hypothetical protein JQC91_01080 [Jannaschia sp. Os4]|uniref:hypothetical protein n=1 Tax=Jannaschia sp. Os4 TaxID=2807617 RepID=UPI00193A4778|nr:hypothetical protein [Jannaschia sp. Os4]MBM2574885.1 hypothetical protein [Jannaschia sp. Os4]
MSGRRRRIADALGWLLLALWCGAVGFVLAGGEAGLVHLYALGVAGMLCLSAWLRARLGPGAFRGKADYDPVFPDMGGPD